MSVKNKIKTNANSMFIIILVLKNIFSPYGKKIAKHYSN